jgi:large subunit ribosomal protein L10
MNRAEKTTLIESMHKSFADNGSVIVMSFKGVNVPDITDLRQKIRDAEGGYEVVKNTLAILAAEGTPVDSVKDQFTGPTAVAYTCGDPVSLAKVLKDFVKTHPGMEFKAAILEGRPIDQSQVESLAEMPSREELLSKVLFLLNAPLTRFASALKSPMRNLAVVLSELAKKNQQ